MNLPLIQLRMCIALILIAVGIEGAQAQLTTGASPAYRACIVSPTASCIAGLALLQAPADGHRGHRYLIYAGADAQASQRWPVDRYKDQTARTELRVAELVQQMRASLLEAHRNGSTTAELKGRLQEIDAGLPPDLERYGEPVMRTDLYRDVAELMARGVRASSWPFEGASFGWNDGVAFRRHLAQRLGRSRDAFVERAKELAIREKAWMSFAKAMAEIGERDEARWAIRQIDITSRPFADDCHSGVAAAMLDIDDFHEADRIVGNAPNDPCHQLRAEIAKRYAQNGEPGRAKEIAHDVLARLPSYLQEMTQYLDGPNLADTVLPLMSALTLAGDRERVLREMPEVERFVRNEGRNLVSFAGGSLGIPQVAQIYYEIGEDAKADALIEADIAEHGSDRHPSWSKPFATAYAKCASGKPNCLPALLSFSGETLNSQTGEEILAWAILAGRRDITSEVVGKQFNIADAWLLDYGKLSFEMGVGDEDAAAQTLSTLIDREMHSGDRGVISRCTLLLRFAVAMEKRDLAVAMAGLILSKILNEASINEPIGSALAETASVLAQLP